MFHLIRFALWLVGCVVVSSFVLNYFQYRINWDYVQESGNRCFGIVKECQENVAKEGEDATCKVACFEFSRLVEKDRSSDQ